MGSKRKGWSTGQWFFPLRPISIFSPCLSSLQGYLNRNILEAFSDSLVVLKEGGVRSALNIHVV